MIFFRAVRGAKPLRRPSFATRLNHLLFGCVFGVLLRLRPPRPREIRLRPEARVLVFSTGGLGDSLLDSVAVRAIAETCPDCEIHAVVHHKRPDIARHNPLLARVHLFRKGPLAFLGLWRVLAALGPWEAVLYLSSHDPESRSLGYLLSPDATIGLAWRTQMGGLTARDLDGRELRREHLARQALAVAAAANATVREPAMVYVVSKVDREELGNFWRAEGGPEGPPVVFMLGGGGASYRDWPAAHFASLARALHARDTGPLVLLGGPDHRRKAEETVSLAGDVPLFNVTGRLRLPLSAALLEKAACLVTTDTGIMHLAFALRTPVAALLHCSPGAARVGPLTDPARHEILQLPKPSGYRHPEDARMETITPDDVLAAVERLMARRSA